MYLFFWLAVSELHGDVQAVGEQLLQQNVVYQLRQRVLHARAGTVHLPVAIRCRDVLDDWRVAFLGVPLFLLLLAFPFGFLVDLPPFASFLILVVVVVVVFSLCVKQGFVLDRISIYPCLFLCLLISLTPNFFFVSFPSPSLCLSVCLADSLSLSLSLCLSVCLSVCLADSLSLCF